MPSYIKTAGRVSVDLNDNGAKQHSYAHGVTLKLDPGWDGQLPPLIWNCSVEDLHDIRHLVDRAIAAAEGFK